MVNEQIRVAVEEVVGKLLAESGTGQSERFQITVAHPANIAHGDYSVNAAMPLAKILKKSPLAIANEIQGELLKRKDIAALFDKVEVVVPGYLNFFLNWRRWAEADWAVHQGEPFDEPPKPGRAGSNQASPESAKSSPTKVLIEHTSINPNKSAHIGHLRNSCIGDTLAKMLKRTGHQVEVHNYIDDLGNQLADTLVGILNVPNEQPFSRFGDFCWEIYAKINKAYKENPDLQRKRAEVLHELEQGRSGTAWMGLMVAERIVEEHLREMKQFGIGYDVLVWESSIVRGGFWSSAFELLKKTTIFHKEASGKLAGCWVLKQGEENEQSANQGDFQADKVLIRSNGILTYTAKDIAYHLWKFGLLDKDFRYKKFAGHAWSTHADGVKKQIGHADMVINVIDGRQEYPQLMVKQALQALGFEQQAAELRHVSYGVVSLSPGTAAGLGVDISDGRSAYPMSGRQGIGIKVSDFLLSMERVINAKRSSRTGLSSRSIAAAALRYYLLRFNLQTEVVFDIEQATEVSGNTGVYLLYAYARACSILDKAGKLRFMSQGDTHPKRTGGEETPIRSAHLRLDRLENQEYSLIRQLAYWPEVLQTAVQELAPHTICTYAHELATLFNHFYATCPIMKAGDSDREIRLWITGRFRDTLHDVLETLGLPTPTSM